MEALASAARSRGRMGGSPWLRAGVIGCVLLLAFVASRTCQKSQIRLTKDQAIATAEREVRFNPTREQVRLVRQGLNVAGAVLADRTSQASTPPSSSAPAVAKNAKNS